MSHSATQAQAMKPRTEVSEQESLQLTRNLLRIAMFNISYIRGLFPENYFQDKFVPALDMKVQKLLPLDMESKRFIDWMEKGVFDALQKKYLRTLMLTICGAHDGPLVEEYMFSFKYAAKGALEDITSMTIESSSGKPVQTNAFDHQTPQQMKRSACKMVRTLVQLMHTLDSVPQERTIIMKLHYYDDVTPADYEPPFFTSTTYEDPSVWSREPLKMKVGHVDSRHYRMAIKMRSIFDPCQDENELAKNEAFSGLNATSEDNSSSDSESTEVNTQPSQPSQKVLTPTELIKSAGGNQLAILANEASALAKQFKNMQATGEPQDVDSDKTEDSKYEADSLRAIRQYLQERENSTVDMTDILGQFPQISVVLIEELVERLVEEELLTKLKKDLYHIKRPQIGWKQAPTHSNASEQPCVPKTEPARSTTNKRSSAPSPRDTEILRNSEEESKEKQHLYKTALLHTLQLEYVSLPELQNALEGVSSGILRQFMSWMSRDGFIENTPKNRRTGRQVLHSLESEKKLQELRAYFDVNLPKTDEPEKQERCDDMDMSQPQSVPGQAVPLAEVPKNRGNSTYGCVQVLGSEVTRQEQSMEPEYSTANNTQTKAAAFFKEPPLPRPPRQELSKQQPTSSEQSINPQALPTADGANGETLRNNKSGSPTDINFNSQSTLDNYGHRRHRKMSKVDGPIYQPPFKRIRAG